MIEPVKSPSTWVLPRGRLALWLAASLVLVTLSFTAGAQARGTNEGEATPNGETETGATVEPAAPAGEAPPAGPEQTESSSATVEQTPPASEAATSAEQTPATGEEALPAEAAAPAGEQAPATEAAAPEQAPAGEPPQTTETAPAEPSSAEQTPPAPAEPSPPTTQTPPATEEPQVEKKTVEQTDDGVAAEAAREPVEEAAATDTSDTTHKDAGDEVASIAAAAVTGPVTAPEISTPPAVSSLESSPQATAIHRTAPVSYEIGGAFGAPIAVNYAGQQPERSPDSSVSAMVISLAAIDSSSVTTRSGRPAGAREGGSVVQDHPSAPIPGSGSGGAGGGAAAAGGLGATAAASFTLVGARLQSAPCAMRRLLLAQQSWRTSFFTLIPERPD